MNSLGVRSILNAPLISQTFKLFEIKTNADLVVVGTSALWTERSYCSKWRRWSWIEKSSLSSTEIKDLEEFFFFLNLCYIEI